MKTFKIKPILGDNSGYGSSDWTDEQWDNHNKYVEKLKEEGKYLTEGEEVTFNFKEHKVFELPKNTQPTYEGFGLFVPKK